MGLLLVAWGLTETQKVLFASHFFLTSSILPSEQIYSAYLFLNIMLATKSTLFSYVR